MDYEDATTDYAAEIEKHLISNPILKDFFE
jgi:hypothetical protein